MEILLHLFFLLIGTVLVTTSTSKDSLTVTYSQGTVIGGAGPSRGGTPIKFWLGIPYAQFPQRFADPVPAPGWTGTLTANWWGPMCTQFGGAAGGVESGCLTINVMVPATANSTNQYPVMVYIHGGGFQAGSSSAYYPQFMLEQNIVLVSFNYRLGLFGFLNAGVASARGNQGMKDQVLGLKWVQKNIEAFGGDKARVTIFGESAGSISVSLLMASPMAKGLFHRAIMQSGTFNSPFTYAKLNGRQCAVAVGQAVGCPTNEMDQLVKCLSRMDPSALAKLGTIWNGLSLSEAALYCGPSIETFASGQDDTFLDKDPWTIVKSGKYSKVPVIIGSVSNTEMYPSASAFVGKPASLAYLNKMWDPVVADALYVAHNPSWFSVTQGAKQHFLDGLPATPNCGLSLGRMLSDRIFTHPVRVLGAELSKSVNVYLYNFTHLVPIHGVPSYPAHAFDIPYFFNVNGAPGIGSLPSELPLSKALIQAWATFASIGSPGKLWGGGNKSWSQNTVTNPCGSLLYADIDTVPSMQEATNQAKSDCQFWTKLGLNEPGQNKTGSTSLD